MRTKDYKRAAGGDFDEDIDLTPIKPDAHEDVRLEVQRERGEVIQVLRPAQIAVRLKHKMPMPSDRDWFSVIGRIFAEGRSR